MARRRLSRSTLVLPLLAAGCLSQYGYRSLDGDFKETEIPWKGRTFEFVQRYFDDWRERAGQPGAVMYRTSRMQWWAPWEWYDLATHQRWDLPYLSPDAPMLPVVRSGQKPGVWPTEDQHR